MGTCFKEVLGLHGACLKEVLGLHSVCLKEKSGLQGVCLSIFSAYEIERRPRGASPASQLLHLFRANYSCTFGARTLGAWLDIDERQMRHLRYRREQTRRAAVNSQERLARNCIAWTGLIAGKPAPTGTAQGLRPMRSRWELACRRCAARAALDSCTTSIPKPGLWRNVACSVAFTPWLAQALPFPPPRTVRCPDATAT